MTRLTDASVAEALGCIRVKYRRTAHGRERLSGLDPQLKGKTPYNVPAFTTSLDAITKEIEARGLDWLVQTDDSGEGHGYFAEIVNANTTSTGKTAALALATALVEFLERRGKL